MDPNASNFDTRRFASVPTQNLPSSEYCESRYQGGTGLNYCFDFAPVPSTHYVQQGIYGEPGPRYGERANFSQQPPEAVYLEHEYHGVVGVGGPAESTYYPYQTQQSAISLPAQKELFAPGSLYPVDRIQPRLFGAPVSALAYDTDYEALFVASGTQSLSRGRFNHRASMLVNYSTVDGMLYSSVAGHPEAPPKVLRFLYNAIYGSGISKTSVYNSRKKVPSHAFRPFYGKMEPGLPDSTAQPSFQMGINQILPIGGGNVASVSPSAVRIHGIGGIQTADAHIEGLMCMTPHPNHDSSVTHLNVGGVGLEKGVSESCWCSDVLCLDLWQGLRIVASYTSSECGTAAKTVITAMATSCSRCSIISGCTDGSIRVLDSCLREVAKIRSHMGGVVDLAVSDDGNLLATVGYGSRGSSLSPSVYSFPDPNIFIYDLRFLGRGGVSQSFAGLNGGPRYLSFLPQMKGHDQSRLLAASGQPGGGMQVIVPFQESFSSEAGGFVLPRLDCERGESITAMHVQDGRVGLGTSKGNVIQYRIAEYSEAMGRGGMSASGMFVSGSSTEIPRNNSLSKTVTTSIEKQVLQMPPFDPPMAELTVEPTALVSTIQEGPGGVNNMNRSVCSLYTLGHSPTLTPTSEEKNISFGPMATEPMIGSSRNDVSDSFLAKSTHSVDFVRTVLASELGIDVLADHRPGLVTKRMQALMKTRGEPLPNPNKFLYNSKLYELVHKESYSRFKRRQRRIQRECEDGKDDHNLLDIPPRYRLSIRPTNKTAAAFSHAEHNDTNLFPGWDYPPTMPNAFVPPVLLLLYFIPETRLALLRCQFSDKGSLLGKKDSLVAELSFLFHRIDCLSRYAMIFKSSRSGQERARIGAWCPSNFVACLAAMLEAEQLQILDGSPAAVETPRRPEAFYRFLLYQIDKELEKCSSLKLMDRLGGVDFASVNEFQGDSTPPSASLTRAMTLELYYDPFLSKGNPARKKSPSFGEVLHRTLSLETPLRAFNDKTGSYETIVQRKIAITLPKVLSLSCACAGRKESDGLFVWRGRGHTSDHWLPETIEIEITQKGNILVRELVRELDTGSEEWITHGDDTSVSAAVAGILEKKIGKAQTLRYQLNAVISMVRDELDKNIPDEIVLASNNNGYFGHHVLHVRVSRSDEKRIVTSQRDELTSFLSRSPHPMALVNESQKEQMEERLRYAELRVQQLEEGDCPGGWVLFNGFKVSRTSAEDARAFHVGFKEPCVVVFRCQEETEAKVAIPEEDYVKVPNDVMCTRSLTNNMRSSFFPNQKPNMLPGPGDLVAFDAEFVSVQEEVSTLTESGSKVTIQETRHAVARISAMACQTKTVIFDDFVLPHERVVDYLTRFSGIVERDLNVKESQRHLITTRAAYLKLRCLVERGCIFVGHGLSRDFWTANLMVPSDQIIDTVEIYHKPAQRYVSLRFLTNFVLKHDMQQEVHDSLEDATAAFELYQKATELKEKGEFEQLLDDLYEYGEKVDWKLGIV